MQSIPLRRGAVGWILFHDLAYSPSSLKKLEETLTDAGCRVVIASLPGEGEIASAYAGIHAHDWIRAARTQTMNLMAECGQVIVMGHGMGALLAMQMAEEMNVRAAVLAAPTLALPTKFACFSGLISRFAPYQSHADPPDLLPEGARDKGIPTMALATVRELASRVLSDAGSIRCRVRILVPQQDAWSDPDFARRLAAGLPHAKAIDLPGATHQCLTGEAGEKLAELCIRITQWAQKEDNHA